MSDNLNKIEVPVSQIQKILDKRKFTIFFKENEYKWKKTNRVANFSVVEHSRFKAEENGEIAK